MIETFIAAYFQGNIVNGPTLQGVDPEGRLDVLVSEVIETFVEGMPILNAAFNLTRPVIDGYLAQNLGPVRAAQFGVRGEAATKAVKSLRTSARGKGLVKKQPRVAKSEKFEKSEVKASKPSASKASSTPKYPSRPSVQVSREDDNVLDLTPDENGVYA